MNSIEAIFRTSQKIFVMISATLISHSIEAAPTPQYQDVRLTLLVREQPTQIPQGNVKKRNVATRITAGSIIPTGAWELDLQTLSLRLPARAIFETIPAVAVLRNSVRLIDSASVQTPLPNLELNTPTGQDTLMAPIQIPSTISAGEYIIRVDLFAADGQSYGYFARMQLNSDGGIIGNASDQENLINEPKSSSGGFGAGAGCTPSSLIDHEGSSRSSFRWLLALIGFLGLLRLMRSRS